MEEQEKKIYCWVEYIDDYNYRHLTPIQEEKDLKYLQKNYNVLRIEDRDTQVDFS